MRITHLNTGTLIRSKHLERHFPRHLRDALTVPCATNPAVFLVGERNDAIVPVGDTERERGVGVSEVDRSGEDPVIDFNERGELVPDEGLERGTGRLEDWFDPFL